jgi:hypothetical protein
MLFEDTVLEESTSRNFHHTLLQIFPGHSVPPHRNGVLGEIGHRPTRMLKQTSEQ